MANEFHKPPAHSDSIKLPAWARLSRDGRSLILDIYVQPGARSPQVSGTHDGRLKVKVQAPPVDGAANEAVLAVIAQYLGIKSRGLELISGHTSRQKSVAVSNIENSVLKRLSRAL